MCDFQTLTFNFPGRNEAYCFDEGYWIHIMNNLSDVFFFNLVFLSKHYHLK